MRSTIHCLGHTQYTPFLVHVINREKRLKTWHWNWTFSSLYCELYKYEIICEYWRYLKRPWPCKFLVVKNWTKLTMFGTPLVYEFAIRVKRGIRDIKINCLLWQWHTFWLTIDNVTINLICSSSSYLFVECELLLEDWRRNLEMAG